MLPPRPKIWKNTSMGGLYKVRGTYVSRGLVRSRLRETRLARARRLARERQVEAQQGLDNNSSNDEGVGKRLVSQHYFFFNLKFDFTCTFFLTENVSPLLPAAILN
jgi:hypothetical protein